MNVRLRLGGELARATGNVRLGLEMSDGATVADLLSVLAHSYPGIASRLDGAIAFVDGRLVEQAHRLLPDQEVALLHAVAGGS